MTKETNHYQRNQQKRTLLVVTWIILIAAVTLAILNIQYRTWSSVIALFGLAVLCVLILILNTKAHYSISAGLLSITVLIVISLNLYDGDGILDSGIVTFPIFILFGALLSGKRLIPYFFLGTVISLIAIVYLEMSGYINPTIHPARISDLYPLITLMLAASLMMWVTMNNYEKNLNRVNDANTELSRNNELTIEAMARILEYRDRETAGHSMRLVVLSTKLAKQLGCSKEEIEQIKRGTMLHDIGKLAIPDTILLKPGSLNEDEINIMQKHPAFGKEMLLGISFLEPSIPIVYSHHEHWNGKGYPLGLKAEQIPLFARIFAIVDCWDALNSDRPYRKAWSREESIKYIGDNAGTLFDANIVEEFLKII